MCIIAAINPGLKLDKETFDRCWDKNPDGFGMAYVWNGRVRIKKTMFKKDAWNIYTNVERVAPDSAKILHWRIGTHGKKDITNCHPFVIHDHDLVFMHNGIIKIDNCPDGLLNDTQMFNNLILKHLPKDFYQQDCYQRLIEEFIGYSKLTFLDKDNNITIFNEKKGEWFEGVWFSNSGYKAPYSTALVSAKKYDIRFEGTTYESVMAMPQDVYDRWMEARWPEYKPYKERVAEAKSKTMGGTPADSYGYHKCEYCDCYTRDAKFYANLEGYLCTTCKEQLLAMHVDVDNMTLDDIIAALFSQDIPKKKEEPKSYQEDADLYYASMYGIGGCY